MAGQWIFDGRCVMVFWTLARGRIVCVWENARLGSALEVGRGRGW